MRTRRGVTTIAGVCAVLALTAASARSAAAGAPGAVEVYSTEASASDLDRLRAGGYDFVVDRPAGTGAYSIELALSPRQRQRLAVDAPELALVLWRNSDGLTFTQQAAMEAQQGYTVWRSWDEPGGIRDELDELARQYPTIAEKVVLGHSIQGREIVAMHVTGTAMSPSGEKPAVLFASLQHAREWLTVEVTRRLLHYMLEGYGQDPDVTRLLDATELWFVLVANPDGYQRTFEPDQRLWRKNLRDNDGDGQIGSADGVDPNRNFPGHWRYDEDGSSGDPSNDGYRGPSAGSEPETQAMMGLLQQGRFAFMVNYHSAAALLLYPIGWQSQTRAIDDPLLVALAGTPDRPAIEGFLPIPSASLYITNGETCDYALDLGTLCFTPELTPAPTGSSFVYPDDETLVEEEFQRNLPFALDVALTAESEGEPVSHLGNTVAPMYVDAFALSYGDPQPVQADCRRDLGEITMAYQINGGQTHRVPTAEWRGGLRYGDSGDVVYRRVRGEVPVAQPGDQVTVWFEAGGEAMRMPTLQSPSFDYRRAATKGSRILVVAAEDYTGTSPDYPRTDGPSYLDAYLDALRSAGYDADVYDVDAAGRRAPSLLGVLSHYDLVVWYTGDDVITRNTGMVAGTASRLARDDMLAMRDYLNEGGRLLVAGRYALYQYFTGYEYDPVRDEPCDPTSGADGCERLEAGFERYYLGGDSIAGDEGTSASGTIHPVVGNAPPFEGLRLTFRAPPQGQADHSQAFAVISARMPAEEFPQFTSWRAADYDRPADHAHGGEVAVYSGNASDSYERLTAVIDVTRTSDTMLRLWVARDTLEGTDAVFVEARTPGSDDWTTLPDTNGHTSSAAALACTSRGWFDRYPQLAHYMSIGGAPDRPQCIATGTTGTWSGATGSSRGDWEPWAVDLAPYAGRLVEISLAYMSGHRPSRGVLIDDVALPSGEVATFEDGLGSWQVAGPPDGHGPNSVDFGLVRAEELPPNPNAAIVVTPQSVWLGFDLSSLATDGERAVLMRRTLDYFLPTCTAFLPSVRYD